MKLHELKYVKGSKFSRKRVGRGIGSGIGKTSGKGMKGQNSRSGGKVRIGFEGGQTPIFRRIPKIGFNNIYKKKYKILNLKKIEKLNISEINHKTLIEYKIIKSNKKLIKIIGNNKINKILNVKINKISKNAKKIITKIGGKVELIY